MNSIPASLLWTIDAMCLKISNNCAASSPGLSKKIVTMDLFWCSKLLATELYRLCSIRLLNHSTVLIIRRLPLTWIQLRDVAMWLNLFVVSVKVFVNHLVALRLVHCYTWQHESSAWQCNVTRSPAFLVTKQHCRLLMVSVSC